MLGGMTAPEDTAADNDHGPEPTTPTPPPADAPAPPVASNEVPGATPAGVPARQRFRDRVLSMRGVVAVALASVILGGLGGAGLASIAGGGREGFGRGDHRTGPFAGGEADGQEGRGGPMRHHDGDHDGQRPGPRGPVPQQPGPAAPSDTATPPTAEDSTT